MIAVLKIILFGLRYPTLMRKADPNRVGGGKKRSCEVCKSANDTSHFERRDTNERHRFLIMLFIYLNVSNVNLASLM